MLGISQVGQKKMVYEKRSEDTCINEEGGLTEDTMLVKN